MEQRRRVFPPFTSALSRTETVLVLLWLPVHILLLPYLLRLAYDRGLISVLWVNVAYYAVGFAYMLLAGSGTSPGVRWQLVATATKISNTNMKWLCFMQLKQLL